MLSATLQLQLVTRSTPWWKTSSSIRWKAKILVIGQWWKTIGFTTKVFCSVFQAAIARDGEAESDTLSMAYYAGSGTWQEPKSCDLRCEFFSSFNDGLWLVSPKSQSVLVGALAAAGFVIIQWVVGGWNMKTRVVLLPLAELVLISDIKIEGIAAGNVNGVFLCCISRLKTAGDRAEVLMHGIWHSG